MRKFREDAVYIDTETIGFHGLAVLIQWAYEDGEVNLHNLWDVPVDETLKLIDWMMEKTVVGFNLTYDHFHLCKIYTMWLCLKERFGGGVIPSTVSVEDLAQAEMDGRDGPCLKPKNVMCLMLHSRKGEYQTLMSRHDVKVTKVPTLLAQKLADELEKRIELDGILFAGRANQNAPKWGVYDRIKRGKEDQVDPNFKDVALKFKPNRGLKYLAQHCLKLDPKFHSFKDVYPERPYKLAELGHVPFALGISSAEKGWKLWDKTGKMKGLAWPALLKFDIEHWRYNEEARQYASDDVKYTRLLDEHWGFPEAGDNDSVLACMVSAVRWHGYIIDSNQVSELLAKSRKVLEASPVNINKPVQVKKYVREVMDESEAVIIDKSTKKANLEKIRSKYVVQKEDLDPDLIHEVCHDCNKSKQCLKCAGTGLEPPDKDGNIPKDPSCVACKGTGECPRCDGTGYEPGAEVCVKCIGEGVFEGKDCPRCEGRGYLYMGPTLASKRANEILHIKAAAKEVELYSKLLQAGRFHASFKVIGTLSSRMAGGDGLNAQGIKGSEEVRSSFPLAWEGMNLCGGDFDGFEVTLADAVFKDAKLREDLLAGKSIHVLMARKIYPDKTEAQIKASKGFKDGGDIDMYTRAKQSVFALLYGGDHTTINKKLSIDIKIAEKACEDFQSDYPGMREARKQVEDMFSALSQEGEIGTGRVIYKEPAEYIETFLGFRRYFTIENKIAKALFDLAQDLPKSWRKLDFKVVRRDRDQTPAGAVSSALYGAAFQIQAANIRAGNNHLIQSPGAMITKHLQRRIWDLQPHGVQDWVVAPINIHDEVLSVTRPDAVDAVADIVVEVVESYRDRVPLIGMGWVKDMRNWADKKGGSGVMLSVGPYGIKEVYDDDIYVPPMDISELDELEEEPMFEDTEAPSGALGDYL
jgi:hypothetical protein